jgi:K+-sensing histidine kinase KdpD
MDMTGSGIKNRTRGRSLQQKEDSDPEAPAGAPTSTSIQSGGDPAASELGAPRAAGGSYFSFLRTLAHDLRNPISGILAASQCLLEDASVFLDVPHVTLLRAIESSSNVMLHVLDDLLEVAQADSGRLRLRLRATNVTKFVRQTVATQQPRADARGIRLNVKGEDNVPRAEIDTAKLRWALNALLGTTIRSCEPGGEIEIHIASQRKRVVIAVRPAGSAAPGRSTEVGSSFSKRGRYQASALAVSTARLIVEGHGGKIRVDQKAMPPAYTLTLPRSGDQGSDRRQLKAASSAA